MYCSSCGIDSVEGLKYCKRCGANLTGSAEAHAPQRAPLALTALLLLVIGTITALGLSTPLLIARDLVNAGLMPKHVVMIFVCSSIVTISIVALLVPVVMRLIGMSQHIEKPWRRPDPTVKSYDPPQSLAPAQPVASVTENTTRSFDAARLEKLQS